MVDSTHRFLTVIKIYQVVKNCLCVVTCIKLTWNSTISCILFKIRIMVLCSHNNTTYGWTRSLFSGMYRKICLGVKIFVRISSSTQKRPKIQPWVEFYHILQPDRPSYQNEPAQKADTGWNMAWHSKRYKHQKSKTWFNHRLYNDLSLFIV